MNQHPKFPLPELSRQRAECTNSWAVSLKLLPLSISAKYRVTGSWEGWELISGKSLFPKTVKGERVRAANDPSNKDDRDPSRLAN